MRKVLVDGTQPMNVNVKREMVVMRKKMNQGGSSATGINTSMRHPLLNAENDNKQEKKTTVVKDYMNGNKSQSKDRGSCFKR